MSSRRSTAGFYQHRARHEGRRGRGRRRAKSYEAGTWRNMPPMARRAVLLKWADLIEAEIPAITVLGVRDNGTEIGMAEKPRPVRP